MGLIQTAGIIASLIMLGIALATVLGTFRPILTIKSSKIDGLKGLDTLSQNVLLVKNIGNRKASKIKVHTNGTQKIPQFNLEPDGENKITSEYEIEVDKIRYKRSLKMGSLFWFTLNNRKKKSLMDSIRSFIPVSDVRRPAGRKKFRKFLEHILDLDLPSENLTILLFDLSYNGGSSIQFASRDSLSDDVYIHSDYSLDWQEMFFELSEMFGKSKDLEDPQRGLWEISRDDLKAAYKKHCNNWLKFDFNTFTKVSPLSSEDAYVILPTSSHLYEISKLDDIGISTGATRSVQVGKLWNQRLQISDKHIVFDNNGFIISDSHKDILISQSIGEPYGETTVFIKEEGVFAGGKRDGVRTVRLCKEASDYFMTALYKGIALPDLKKNGNERRPNSKIDSILAYMYWSFNKGYYTD